MVNNFSTRVLQWYRQHGRHNLPWQKNKTLYRVWVAEVMLQQTQVAAVLPYYQRFMQAFPHLAVLAAADMDEVLSYWSGLGYYARARNMHTAAQRIVEQFDADFPHHYDDVIALPGIGPSTAAAILAQALNQPHAILDGNVKRVLARYHGIEGWPGLRQVEQQLWEKARLHTPAIQVADYTQAMMDMGAILCTRSSANCGQCPLNADCVALAENKVGNLPTKRPKKKRPVRQKCFLVIHHTENGLLMEKRPTSGIWGGLWSFPETELEENIIEVCLQRWGLTVQQIKNRPVFRHTFSHFHLDILPCHIQVKTPLAQISEAERFQWCLPDDERAMATPVRSILNELLKTGMNGLTQRPLAD